MSRTNEYPQLLEIDAGNPVHVTMFTANGEHLISTGDNGVQVWGIKDGKRVATMPVESGADRVAVSRDGRFIAAGLYVSGSVIVWDATTYEQVSQCEVGFDVWDVDFSPDSTHLVLANWGNCTAIIWDIATCKGLQKLDHKWVFAAKYSPRGDQIVTAGQESIRVWDSNSGRLLVDVKEFVPCGDCLFLHNNHLFVATRDRKIKQIDPFTQLSVFEWPIPTPIPDPDISSIVAMPQHVKLIVYSVKETITFLDPSENTQLGSIQHTDHIRSIACSSDGQLLAVAAGNKITVKDLSSVLSRFVSVPTGGTIIINEPPSTGSHSISEPELDIDSIALDAWKHDQLTDAEALLSAGISTSQNSTHHILASRALVRARMGDWDAALVDAKQSIKVQRSLFGYTAKCVALVGRGEKDEGIRVCDIAFEHFHSKYTSLLLLVKSVVLFMAGDHLDAISRVNDLIIDSAHMSVDPALYGVQAYMHFIHGNKCMEDGDYEYALQSFEDASIKLSRARRPPLIVSLISEWHFDDLAIAIQQRLCEALLATDCTREASECMIRMLDEEVNITESIATWVLDFKSHCRSKLEERGDSAMKAKHYGEAISEYTLALSLDPVIPQDLLVKRSRAYAENGKWEGSLRDASEAIRLDPSSPSSYERKHAALLGLSRHDDAIDAFETMLLKMSESSDPNIRERSGFYVWPEQIRKAIRTSIKNTLHNSPLLLINTLSGCLCNKTERASAFESIPAFTTLVTSMTTHIDHALIEQVVGEFYRYATFSHVQEDADPLYETVMKTAVYDLDGSPTHNELQMFCKIARDEGFNWAWNDTCCIDQEDQFVLQESIVNRFNWYEGSAMTVIFLCDVDQLAEAGALVMSLWSSRVWALLEYHASKVVRFYTKDWTPYLGLTIYNHKDSPEITLEMEIVTGIPAESLMALRPGLTDIRKKLRLASTRETARIEDVAYSLLGIFSMTLPIAYGEGDRALGRLLSQLLTSSGDTSILAWNGRSGSFNSCLPTDIVVFSRPVTLHIPSAIPDAEMKKITADLDALSLDLDLVARLYHRVDELPSPTFSGQQMMLSCLSFKITDIKSFRDGSGVLFYVQAGALGTVKIKTSQNITVVDSLYLVHPWINFLLDRRAGGNMAEVASETFELDELPLFVSFPEPSSILDEDPLDDVKSFPSPNVPLMDTQMEFLVRLRQPFGALLLAPIRRNVAVFRRIATENVITAQVEEITSVTLSTLIENVRVLNVL